MRNKVTRLCGGGGSGKSTAAMFFAKKGAKTIDADEISHIIIKKGGRAFEEIVDAFGKNILGEDGEIIRANLGKIVFSDAKQLDKLNKIMHKYIAQEIKAQICGGICVIDAALPDTFGINADITIAVTAREDTRIKRITARDAITEAEAKNRINSQISDEEYKLYADITVDNSGDEKEFESKIMKLAGEIF